jgi:DNA-directed RNA polymerase III subunit RPC6
VKKKKNYTDSESSSDDDTSRKKSKKKKKKSDLSSDDSDSGIDYRKNSKSKSMKQSQLETMGFDDLDTSAGSVYRALKESTIPFAWMESPCGVCPSFEFCKPGGPVNPQECSYYGDWLLGGTASNEIEELS